MNRIKIFWLGISLIFVLLSIFLIIVWRSSVIPRLPFSAPEPAHQNWDEILSHPQPISIRTYSTGLMQTNLSSIMNFEHEKAQSIEDVVVEIPVNVSIIQHQEFGPYLIDAGLDASYVHSPHGTINGILVKSYLGKGTQEPNTHIAAILNKDNIQLQGVFLTHLHFDHTAGILDLPKDIPYITGKGERYTNFTFFMRGDHLAGIDELHEIDFSTGIDLPPFGKSVDVFGDGSLWAISSSGHSKGHVIFFINGIDDKVLVTVMPATPNTNLTVGLGRDTFQVILRVPRMCWIA